MELLFAALGGAVIGMILHLAMPGADTRGLFWLAGWAASSAIVVWEILTWLEWKSDSGWIWTVTLVVSALTAAAVARVGTQRRRQTDKELLESLFKGASV